MTRDTTRGSAPIVWITIHDLSRTGVPIMLARLLRATPAEARSSIHVVAVHGGPLSGQIASLCATLTILEPTGRRSFSGAFSVGLRTLGADSLGSAARRLTWTAKLSRHPRPDLVLAHGAGSWQVVDSVPGEPPAVLHLHELQTGLDRSISPPDQAEALGRARRVMVVSAAVADLAVERGARSGGVLVVPGVVDLGEVAEDAGDDGSRDGPADTDVPRWVLGAGVPGWRKGTDRLAALAHGLAASESGARVGWVGGAPHGVDSVAVGSYDPVTWFDASPDPWSILGRASVFVIPSREDPLPLVALEAGLRCRPVVALPTGGLPELLSEGRGLVGRTHDLRWFVAAVARVLDSPALAADLGAALRAHVVAHHDAERIAQIWWQALMESAGE